MTTPTTDHLHDDLAHWKKIILNPFPNFSAFAELCLSFAEIQRKARRPYTQAADRVLTCQILANFYPDTTHRDPIQDQRVFGRASIGSLTPPCRLAAFSEYPEVN